MNALGELIGFDHKTGHITRSLLSVTADNAAPGWAVQSLVLTTHNFVLSCGDGSIRWLSMEPDSPTESSNDAEGRDEKSKLVWPVVQVVTLTDVKAGKYKKFLAKKAPDSPGKRRPGKQ